MRFFVAFAATFLISCGKKERAADAQDDQPVTGLRESDQPLLPVAVGDRWTYRVTLLIPAGVSPKLPQEYVGKYERARTYIGMVQPSSREEEVQCFEVYVPGSPGEREFVSIKDDVILMHGSEIESDPPQVMWLSAPVPFVVAGMKRGDMLKTLRNEEGSLVRNTEVVGREEITVPAGTYSCIRLLTTGSDTGVDLRRTVWFSPRHGIIREEKSRYLGDKLIFRETHELIRISRGK